MIKIPLIFSLLLAGIPTWAFAQEMPAEQRLVQTANSLFKNLKTETLPNGLRVYLLPVEGSPLVTTMVAYKVGACDEEKDQTGLSHYLEHLLFKGTEKLMPGDIDRATQRNGGRNNAYTSEDMTVYHFDFAADRWQQALEIEADRMRNCRIDAKHEFEQEKGAVISELKGGEDQPWELEYKKILTLLFPPKSPYSHPVIGDEKHVRAASAEIIKRHYDLWYHPNNAALVIAGGFDADEAMKLVTKLFGSIPKQDLPERKPYPPIPERTELTRVEIPSKFDVPRLMMGFNTVKIGDPDDYVLDMIDGLLSSGKTSRLYRRLVEKDRLANSVGTGNYSGRYPGWYAVQVEMLQGEDRTKAEAAIFEELGKLAQEKVSEEELQGVRRRMLASLLYGRESVHDLADLISRAVTSSSLEYLQTYLDKINAVTPGDIQKAAAKYFVPEKAVLVWTVPPAPQKPLDQKPPGAKGVPPPQELRNPCRLGGLSAILREEPPAGAAKFSMNNAKRIVLPNGMVVILLENHQLPIVVVEADFGDLNLQEPKELNGITALLGLTLEEGTSKHTGAEIADQLESVGASLSLSSDSASLKVLTPDLPLGLDLMFECLSEPTFPEDAVEQKRAQLLSIIADVETQPRNRADQKLRELIYGEHPYGRNSYGQKAIVEKLTRQQLRDYHQKWYGPNRLTVVVVGDFESESMIQALKDRTKTWAKSTTELAKIPQPDSAGKPGEFIMSDPTAAQTHVYIGKLGIDRKHPDYVKLQVMDNVLGTGPGFTDRLSATLRDRQGLAYTVRATITGTAGTQVGMFQGYIGTFPEKYVWVRQGFLKEMERIRDEQPTAEEVNAAKEYLLGSLPFRFASREGIAAQLLLAERYGLGFNYLEQYKKDVAAVTPADVQAMAKKHLDLKKLSIVAVGPIDMNGQPLQPSKE